MGAMSSMVSPGKTCTRGQHTCSISESQWLLRGAVDSRQMWSSALASERDAASSGKTRGQGWGALTEPKADTHPDRPELVPVGLRPRSLARGVQVLPDGQDVE